MAAQPKRRATAKKPFSEPVPERTELWWTPFVFDREKSMQFIPKGVALIAASAALALPVFAQNSAPTAQSSAPSSKRVDAADPKAAVPPLVYSSVLQGYRPNVEVEVGSWKDANDNVGRIGGWRVYAKEARQPDAVPPAAGAASTPARPDVKPMPADHAGHKMN